MAYNYTNAIPSVSNNANAMSNLRNATYSLGGMSKPSNPYLVPEFAMNPEYQAAMVLMQQYSDYQRRFQPLENQLMGQTMYTNPNLVNDEIAQGQGFVNNAFSTQAAQHQRSLQSFGLAPDQRTQQANNISSAIGRSASIVDAANRIRQNVTDRSRAIISGGAGSSGF